MATPCCMARSRLATEDRLTSAYGASLRTPAARGARLPVRSVNPKQPKIASQRRSRRGAKVTGTVVTNHQKCATHPRSKNIPLPTGEGGRGMGNGNGRTLKRDWLAARSRVTRRAHTRYGMAIFKSAVPPTSALAPLILSTRRSSFRVTLELRRPRYCSESSSLRYG